jgi:hypothetical protein
MTYKIIGGDHKEYGPETTDQVRQWIAEGRANGQTLAKAEGSTEWKPLSAHPEFSALFASMPPATSPVPGYVSPTGVSSEQILAGDTDLDVPSCLSRAWVLLKSNFGLLFGATALIWLISFVTRFIPFVGLFLHGILFGGLYNLFLKRIRGQPASIGDAFSGFGPNFIHLLLAGFVSTVLTFIGAVCCAVLPGIYLAIAWVFCVALAADKRLEFWSAMELSRKVATRVWFAVLGLVLVAFAPFLAVSAILMVKSFVTTYSIVLPMMQSGSSDPVTMFKKMMEASTATFGLQMLAQAALAINLPFATAALMYAYEDLFNPRTAPTA